MAYLSISNISDNGCSWSIDGLSNPFDSTYYSRVGVTTSSFTSGSTSISSIIDYASPPSSPSGLINWFNSGTSYTLYGFAQDKYGKYWSAGSYTFTTKTVLPKHSNPYADVHSTTSTTIELYLNCAEYGTFHITNDSTYQSYTIYSKSTYYTINGLTPDTTYSFSIYMEADSYYMYSDTISVSGKTKNAKPEPFYWSNASDMISGNEFKVYAYDFNSLCDKINELLTYKSLPTRSFQTVSIGMSFYATLFNAVVNAIDSMNYTGIPTKNTGDKIYASDLILLQNTLNSIT